jgi:hypothetical protein
MEVTKYAMLRFQKKNQFIEESKYAMLRLQEKNQFMEISTQNSGSRGRIRS